MRTLTDHIVSGDQAVQLKIEVTDEPGQGGANHAYDVGIVGYQPVTPRMGWFHGICFTRSACDHKTPRAGVTLVLTELFSTGVERIGAAYFADNHRVGRFLKNLGAHDEGCMARHTLRGGEPVDMRLAALFKKAT